MTTIDRHHHAGQPKTARAALQRRLLKWFDENARAMPWRGTRDPYRIWLSEVMLQQTQVATVIPYYVKFIRYYPDVRALAAADDDMVMKLWEGLGYYRRAHHMLRAARAVVREAHGRFPENAEGLMRLPGIGKYSAHAIASIAYSEPKAVLDGNVKRLLARVFGIAESIDDPQCVRLMWDIAQSLLPPERPGDFNQAMMELGAIICKPRNPACRECPIRSSCRACQDGSVERLPRRNRRKPLPHHHVVAGVLAHRGRILIGKRPATGLLSNLWEFPGGKLEPGETPGQALKREFLEETGLEVAVGESLGTVKHTYTHFKITLTVFCCRKSRGRLRVRTHQQLKWVKKSEIPGYAFPLANRKIMPLIPEC